MSLLVYVVGSSLLHFLWQGAVIAAAAAAALRIIPAASSRARYAVASMALAAMLVSPAVTAGMLMSSASLSRFDAATAVSSRAPRAPSPISDDTTLVGRNGVVPGASLPDDTLLTLVVSAWLAGVVLCLTRLAGGWWRVRRLHRASLSLAASAWQATTDQLAARLDLRRSIKVVDSTLVDTPALVGWLRPVILLPIAALANLTPPQVEAILAHELAHVRRHDYIVNLLQTAAETLLFYHPAVWWLSGRIRAEREHCCDDVAVMLCGNAADYAAALEELEVRRATHAGLAIAATGGPLLERVRRLLQAPADDQRPSANLGVMTALVLLLVVVSGGLQHLPASRLSQAAAPPQARKLPPPPPPAPPPPDGGLQGWRLSQTASFEISYPPELESQVERVGREAEAAYAQLKLDLRHELAFKPRLVLFATRRDMERALASGAMPGAVEHILMPLDASPARLRGDLVHEISHVFGFDILPASRGNDVPVWIVEGLAELERGEWEPGDTALLRDLVRTGSVPRISSLDGSRVPGDPRLNPVLGHAVFDFIVSRAGKDGMRRFLLAVRQAPAGGLPGVYLATFGLTPDDFDRAFVDYLEMRFRRQR